MTPHVILMFVLLVFTNICWLISSIVSARNYRQAIDFYKKTANDWEQNSEKWKQLCILIDGKRNNERS